MRQRMPPGPCLPLLEAVRRLRPMSTNHFPLPLDPSRRTVASTVYSIERRQARFQNKTMPARRRLTCPLHGHLHLQTPLMRQAQRPSRSRDPGSQRHRPAGGLTDGQKAKWYLLRLA